MKRQTWREELRVRDEAGTNVRWLLGRGVTYGFSCYNVKDSLPKRGQYKVLHRLPVLGTTTWRLEFVSDDVLALFTESTAGVGAMTFGFRWDKVQDVTSPAYTANVEAPAMLATAHVMAKALWRCVREVDTFLADLDLESEDLADLDLTPFYLDTE